MEPTIQKFFHLRLAVLIALLLASLYTGGLACTGGGGGGATGGGTISTLDPGSGGPGIAGGEAPPGAISANGAGNQAGPEMGTRADDPSIEIKLSVARQMFYGDAAGGKTWVDPNAKPIAIDLPQNGDVNLKFLTQIKYWANSPDWISDLAGRPVRLIYRPGTIDDPSQFKYIDTRVNGVIAPGDFNVIFSNLHLGVGTVSLYLYEVGAKKSEVDSGKSPYAPPPGYSETLTPFASPKDYDEFFNGIPPVAPSVHHLGTFRLGSMGA